RVCRPPGAELPARRAAANPAVADAFVGHLVLSYRRAALPRIQLWPLTANGQYGTPEEVAFDSELMASGLAGNPNWDAPRLRIAATSFVVPLRVYDLDLRTGERILLREQPVLGEYRPEDYVERRDWAVAADGARVPVSLIYRKGIEFPAPALLYGYGAYESCEDPRFSIARLSLLDRGMVFAVAHVR
ncbi:oligopeptidase B, partial [Mycolicibacterium sphagni]|nr:oligopeptidase B [Mycolicibacterium sphagni]